MAEGGERRSPTGVAPVLQLHPTRRCNIACAHCYTASGPTAREELHTELLLSCIDDASALGYGQLAVSGGEPLLVADLGSLLHRARGAGMVTTVTSNGMLLTPRRWEPLAGLVDVLAVSVDGRPDEHDRIRRRAGAFERMRANLETVRASGTPFALIFTLTQENLDSLDFVVRLAAHEGAAAVHVHPLTLHGRAAETMPDDRPDEQELVVASWEARRLGSEVGVPVHVDLLTADQLRHYRDRLVPALPVEDVVDVAPVLVVGAGGAVVPMTHEVDPSLHLGSVLDAPLTELVRRWVAAGGADRLAAACALAWDDLTGAGAPAAAYWYDEVAARTAPRAVAAGAGAA